MQPTTQDMEQGEAYISHVPLSSWAEDIYKKGLTPGSWEVVPTKLEQLGKPCP